MQVEVEYNKSQEDLNEGHFDSVRGHKKLRPPKQPDDLNFLCRGPESNWPRLPFQGSALPLSYLGILKRNFISFRPLSATKLGGFVRTATCVAWLP